MSEILCRPCLNAYNQNQGVPGRETAATRYVDGLLSGPLPVCNACAGSRDRALAPDLTDDVRAWLAAREVHGS